MRLRQSRGNPFRLATRCFLDPLDRTEVLVQACHRGQLHAPFIALSRVSWHCKRIPDPGLAVSKWVQAFCDLFLEEVFNFYKSHLTGIKSIDRHLELTALKLKPVAISFFSNFHMSSTGECPSWMHFPDDVEAVEACKETDFCLLRWSTSQAPKQLLGSKSGLETL